MKVYLVCDFHFFKLHNIAPISAEDSILGVIADLFCRNFLTVDVGNAKFTEFVRFFHKFSKVLHGTATLFPEDPSLHIMRYMSMEARTDTSSTNNDSVRTSMLMFRKSPEGIEGDDAQSKMPQIAQTVLRLRTKKTKNPLKEHGASKYAASKTFVTPCWGMNPTSI